MTTPTETTNPWVQKMRHATERVIESGNLQSDMTPELARWVTENVIARERHKHEGPTP